MKGDGGIWRYLGGEGTLDVIEPMKNVKLIIMGLVDYRVPDFIPLRFSFVIHSYQVGNCILPIGIRQREL